jgi:NAD(P)-dependent dehydrogenase (short-subunit alcohol dehydrogenase family)
MANVLVTGSNSGFGRLTTLSLAKRGHSVAAAMRDSANKNRAAADELRAIAGVHVIELDVNDTASTQRGVDAAIAATGPLDVVVNNAGYAIMGLVETVAPEQLLAELDTNVVGMLRVARAALPHMHERKRGALINLSSGLGRIVIPQLGTYAASKWAVEAMCESLRYELKAIGLDSTIVQPGAFPTNFGRGATLGADQARAAGYGPFANGLAMMAANFEKMFSGPNPPDPQLVATAIVELVEMPQGTRPARVIVDAMGGDSSRVLNDAHAAVQKRLLDAMGMGMLAD